MKSSKKWIPNPTMMFINWYFLSKRNIWNRCLFRDHLMCIWFDYEDVLNLYHINFSIHWRKLYIFWFISHSLVLIPSASSDISLSSFWEYIIDVEYWIWRFKKSNDTWNQHPQLNHAHYSPIYRIKQTLLYIGGGATRPG